MKFTCQHCSTTKSVLSYLYWELDLRGWIGMHCKDCDIITEHNPKKKNPRKQPPKTYEEFLQYNNLSSKENTK